VAIRDELDIPMPAMAPSYRPSAARARDSMDPATRRLAIFAAVIGAGLLGLVGAWSFTGHRHGGVPVIEAPAGPVKVKPANPGGLQVAGAGESILTGEGDGKETVAPGPEAPEPLALKAEEEAAADAAAPAPVAPVPVAPPGAPAALPPSSLAPPNAAPPAGQAAVEADAPEAAAPAETAPPRPRLAARPAAGSEGAAPSRPPAPAGASEPPPGPPLRRIVHAAPVVMAQAATSAARAAEPAQDTGARSGTTQGQAMPNGPATMTPVPAAGGQAAPPAAAPATQAAAATVRPAPRARRPMVQFAALGSGAEALAEWQRLTQKFPDLLGDHTPNITKTERAGKVYWRIRTAGFNDLPDAVAFCDKLRARGGTCVATF